MPNRPDRPIGCHCLRYLCSARAAPPASAGNAMRCSMPTRAGSRLAPQLARAGGRAAAIATSSAMSNKQQGVRTHAAGCRLVTKENDCVSKPRPFIRSMRKVCYRPPRAVVRTCKKYQDNFPELGMITEKPRFRLPARTLPSYIDRAAPVPRLATALAIRSARNGRVRCFPPVCIGRAHSLQIDAAMKLAQRAERTARPSPILRFRRVDACPRTSLAQSCRNQCLRQANRARPPRIGRFRD